MDRERAELYLRLLAEEELRRARPGLQDTEAQAGAELQMCLVHRLPG